MIIGFVGNFKPQQPREEGKLCLKEEASFFLGILRDGRARSVCEWRFGRPLFREYRKRLGIGAQATS